MPKSLISEEKELRQMRPGACLLVIRCAKMKRQQLRSVVRMLYSLKALKCERLWLVVELPEAEQEVGTALARLLESFGFKVEAVLPSLIDAKVLEEIKKVAEVRAGPGAVALGEQPKGLKELVEDGVAEAPKEEYSLALKVLDSLEDCSVATSLAALRLA
ncbi:MAG: hypothetical protein GXO07_01895 [Crenarchaeota archaeon]|nr:hypothetical protein [Thermoproteota archaeon]